MNATKLFDLYLRENLDNERCGIAHGGNIIEAGPFRYFGCESSGREVKRHNDYLYYYGEADETFGSFPEPTIVLGECEDGTVVYLWEIDNESN